MGNESESEMLMSTESRSWARPRPHWTATAYVGQLVFVLSSFLFFVFVFFVTSLRKLPDCPVLIFLMYYFFIFYMGRLHCNRDKSCRNLQELSQNGSLRHGRQQSDHFPKKCLLMSRVGAGAGPVWRYCASPSRGQRCLSVLWATFNY